MATKVRTTAPVATGGATSRPSAATLETIVLRKDSLEMIQRAIHAGMVAGKKPTTAQIATALGAVIS